ncbi:DMT family transporter [Humitalea sp. 24SJ18S-53]|uniref:DMT family transporter n=1 Tax=Humitalea sp. 24SJ18S-53 TaxID=3422307 RepID=UPI003D668469
MPNGTLRHDPKRGAILMVIACVMFVMMSAIVKDLAERLPFMEVMFFRCALAIPLVLVFSVRTGVVSLRTRRLGAHVARACTGMIAMSCAFFSLTVLPLAEQSALTQTTPIFATILAIPLLGERPGVARWTAVGLGFVGIMAIAMGQGAFWGGGTRDLIVTLGFAAALVHGIFSALTTLLVRSLSGTESSSTIVLWQSLLMSSMIGLTLPFIWVTPSWPDVLLLLGCGLFGGIAQVMLTEAWASSEVSAVAPFAYSSLLWAALFGWVFWGELPGLWTWVGSGLIVAAGLGMLRAELRRKRTKA